MNHIQPPHNCTDFITDISMLLDGELDRHSENQLMEEIHKCPICKQYYNNQAAYKKNVCAKVMRRSCGEDLKDSLRAKFRGL